MTPDPINDDASQAPELLEQGTAEEESPLADLTPWQLPSWLGDEEEGLGLIPAPGAPAPVVEPRTVPTESLSDAGPALPPGVQVRGNLEEVREGTVTGWVAVLRHDTEQSLPRVRILLDDGTVLGEGVASGFRQDVASAGLGSGWGGFVLPVDLPHRDVAFTVQLQVESDNEQEPGSSWLTVSRKRVESLAAPRALQPTSLLSAFAAAGVDGARIERSGVHVGDGLWVQAASGVAGHATVSLQLVPGPAGDGSRISVVRLESEPDVGGRADVRLRLAEHAHAVNGGWVRLRVFPRSGAQQQLRVNVHSHAGRISLGDFVVRSHQWATLHVKVPDHRCEMSELSAERAVIWLELVLEAGAPIDIAGPELVQRSDLDPFECLNVELQQGVFAGAPQEPVGVERPFTVVVPFYGKAAFTAACVNSLLACSWSEPDIIVIDDGSPHPHSARHLLEATSGRVRLLRSDVNHGYTASVNRGVQSAQTDLVVILNNDTRVTPGWDEPLLKALEDPSVFAAGPLSNAASYQSAPQLRSDKGWAVNRYPAGVTPVAIASGLRQRFSSEPIDLAVLNGFCYAVRRADFLRLGGLDEEAFPHGYGEEVDLMLRARSQGLRNVVTPRSFVYHYKSVTFAGRRDDLSKRGTAVVRERWGRALEAAVREMDLDEQLPEVRAAFAEILAATVKESER